MNLFALSGLFVCINSLLFCGFSWVKGKKFLNKIWAFFNLAVAIWGFGAFKFASTLDPDSVFFWLHFGHIGVIFIPVLFLHFVFEFLEIKKKWPIYFAYAIGIFFSVLNLTDWLHITKVFIVSLRYVFNSFYVDSPPGPLYPLFVVFFFGSIVYGHYCGMRHLRISSELKSMQIKYFLLATILGFGGGGTAFLMVFKVDIYPILHFTVPLYPIIMTYAITKARLMDISVVISRSLAEFLTTLFLSSIYLFLVWLHQLYLSPSIDIAFLAGTIIYGILVGQTYQFIRTSVQTGASRKFIKGWRLSHS